MQRLLITGGIIVALLLIVVANAFYIVRVDQQAIVLRFGEAQYVVNSDAAQAKAGAEAVANAARTCKGWSKATLEAQRAALQGKTFAESFGSAAIGTSVPSTRSTGG